MRPIFAQRRAWLGVLCRIAARLLRQSFAATCPGAKPGLILFVQTFGDLVNFHPHVHVLAADGAFLEDGAFVSLPPLGWRHGGGFSVHNRVWVAADDAEGRMKLAGTMLRAPLSLAKMSYDATSGTVIYRSKMHLGLKRNFQVMPGAEWMLGRHIPDRYEHLVRTIGWYSNRAQGERAKKAPAPLPDSVTEPVSELARAAPRPPGRGSSARYTRPIRWNARSARGRCALLR